MKRWFYNKFYLLVAAARERLCLVTVKLGRIEDYLWEVSIKSTNQQSFEKRGEFYDCKSN